VDVVKRELRRWLRKIRQRALIQHEPARGGGILGILYIPTDAVGKLARLSTE